MNFFDEKFGQRIVFLDGATGSNLAKRGMPSGVCPEQWILENEDILIGLQQEYVDAGCDIVYAPTFGGNRIKLAEYGLEDKLAEINTKLVQLSKKAVGNKALVAGDLTMTGKQLYPVGTMQFEELVDVYKEQIKVLSEVGCDLLVVETMMSLQETRAAVIAAKETCDLPVIATLSFESDGKTLYGTDAVTAALVLEGLGVDAVGVNCSTGPEQMVQLVADMRRHIAIPVIAKPNAGMPSLDENGKTVYAMSPEEFAKKSLALIEAGAGILGGCCGTTPEHIKALYELTHTYTRPEGSVREERVLTSEHKTVLFGLDDPFLVIGERINPTGKKALQAELREGKMDMVRRFAMEQEAGGAALLDINTGMSGIDELAMTKEVIYEVSSTVDCPLVLDTSHIDVMEAALRAYPGRALINSISLESAKCDAMLTLAKEYGAMFILLPLSDKGLPENASEKLDVLEQIYAKAMEHGLAHEDIIVDGLVTTVGANVAAGVECFDTIAYCKNDRQLPTICGLSNISFGLPERGTVNSTFLTMAMAKGLTMAIANPCQEQLMNAMFAADMLLHHPNADVNYIAKMNRVDSDEENSWHPIYRDVVKGNGSVIVEAVQAELSAGMKAEAIINEHLIPAINYVGQLFNDNKYFLPQLIRSANTMKIAIDYVEPLLEKKDSGKTLPTVIIATVKGDIHDIGKNLVVLMMKNYGYPVIDLGKDVPAEVIVETAIRENAAVIGLSALMTTTMMRMQDVVDLCKARGCQAKIVIGGACITEDFAVEIGADAYAKDAADTVRVVERLLQ